MKKQNSIKNDKGQSIVEFTLIIPVLLVVLIGIFEFGIMLNGYLSINNASRDGARYASVGSSDSKIRTVVYDALPTIDNSKITISISPSESSRNAGDSVKVQILYNYDVTMPIISKVIGNSIVLKAETTMRVE